MRLLRPNTVWLTALGGAWGAPGTAAATPVGVEFEDEDEDEEIPDFVEAPEPPPPAPAPAAAPAPAPRWRSSVGGGVAHFAADGPGEAQDSLDNWGVAVYARTGLRIAPSTRLRLGASAAFTEFDRTAEMWDTGSALGRWTTDAYGGVYDWIGRGVDDKTWPLRVGLGVPAFTFLTMPYVLAGAFYLFGPLASGTFATVDATVSRSLGPDELGLYAEAGLGLLVFSHPRSPTPRAGMGPIVGLGVDVGPWTLGARTQWSPPALHDDEGIAGSDIWATTLTAGFSP